MGLTFGLPLPDGCPTGYVGPGGISDGGKHFNCTGGAARYIDALIFTEDHLGHWGLCEERFQCRRIDPCALFGVLPSTLQVFLGMVAGFTFIVHRDTTTRLLHLLVWALGEVRKPGEGERRKEEEEGGGEGGGGEEEEEGGGGDDG